MPEPAATTLTPTLPMSTLAVGISIILSSTSTLVGVSPDMLIANRSFGV